MKTEPLQLIHTLSLTGAVETVEHNASDEKSYIARIALCLTVLLLHQ